MYTKPQPLEIVKNPDTFKEMTPKSVNLIYTHTIIG